jgi:nucleotide-binding universal stress UspA family protein
MSRKILVPIAFSTYSKGILRFAFSLAKPLGAKLFIVNVVNERSIEAIEKISSHGYKLDGDKYIATIQQERITRLEEMVGELGISDDDYEYVMLVGDPATELLRMSVREGIDMVVMGTKTRELRHIFTGSVAERMFRRCPIPVISYRDEDIAKRLERKIHKEMDD